MRQCIERACLTIILPVTLDSCCSRCEHSSKVLAGDSSIASEARSPEVRRECFELQVEYPPSSPSAGNLNLLIKSNCKTIPYRSILLMDQRDDEFNYKGGRMRVRNGRQSR